MSIWEHKPLSELCTIEIGGTPTRNNPIYWDSDNAGSNYWVSIADLKQREIIETAERITNLGIRHSNAKLCKKGTVLMSFKLTVGRVAIAGRDLYTNEAIAAFTSKNLDHDYLYYGLQHWNLLKNVDQAIKGITLNKSKLKKIEAHYPVDKKEQSKIAEVLTTIDRAIAQNEALFAKHQRIKTGLMQDLLTSGIDKHGELRNSVAHPDQFTKSDFGLFPKAWKITTLGKIIADAKGLIQTGPFGTQVHAYDYVEEGIPTMMPQYVDETGWIELEDLPRLTPAKALELRRHALKENDVIFARRGELSKCSAISKREEGWICGSDFMLVRVSSSIMSGEWFAHYYRDDIGQRQVMAQAVGSIMKGINTQLMMSLVVALPSIEEQTRILAIIDSQEKIIKETIDQHKKLLKIKHGLMQDLLSGEVSVTPLMGK